MEEISTNGRLKNVRCIAAAQLYGLQLSCFWSGAFTIDEKVVIFGAYIVAADYE
jgi:hypothetical protein